jgi:hypothetical protein
VREQCRVDCAGGRQRGHLTAGRVRREQITVYRACIAMMSTLECAAMSTGGAAGRYEQPADAVRGHVEEAVGVRVEDGDVGADQERVSNQAVHGAR